MILYAVCTISFVVYHCQGGQVGCLLCLFCPVFIFPSLFPFSSLFIISPTSTLMFFVGSSCPPFSSYHFANYSPLSSCLSIPRSLVSHLGPPPQLTLPFLLFSQSGPSKPNPSFLPSISSLSFMCLPSPLPPLKFPSALSLPPSPLSPPLSPIFLVSPPPPLVFPLASLQHCFIASINSCYDPSLRNMLRTAHGLR